MVLREGAEQQERPAEGGGRAASLERLARVVAQKLELSRLFGWDPPLRAAACRPQAPTPPGAPVSSASGPVAAPGVSEPRPSAPAASAPGRFASPSSPRPAPAASAPAIQLDPSEREALLEAVRAEVADCERCALCRGRTQTVFGVGSPAPRLIFVGEGPGFEEDRKGEPFVGPAGQLLDRIIEAIGLTRPEVYIANVVKCRPPNNRNPDPAESAACLPYLERQLEILRPEVIVTLGAVATRALLDCDGPLGRFRGRFHDRAGIPVMPTYHPAYLLRNPADKRKVWDDMQCVMRRLGLKAPQRPS